jgi:hypothetical protein
MRATLLAAGALGAATLALAGATSAGSGAPTYAVARGDYETDVVMTVGDKVPEASNPLERYQLVGLPDGMGAYRNGALTTLWVNHEFGSSVTTQPVVGGPVYKGSYVSRFVLGPTGKPLFGERAFDRVYVGDTLVGPAAEVGNSTRPFARFCSGALGTPADGFTKPIYFAGEEEDSSAAFDPGGGQAVAFYENEAHVLPKIGKMSIENVVPQRRGDGPTGKTVLMVLEDGPADPLESQLYMFVGTKQATGTTLQRNGLHDGTLYALKVSAAAAESPADTVGAVLDAAWVPLASPESKTEPQLNAAAVTAGAFGFARVEDGAFDADDRNRFYFVTTGGNNANNKLGRVYQLDLDPANPADPAKLKLVVDADKVVAGGGDTALSPDNVGTASGWLMVQEDGTSQSRPVMGAKGRDGAIWRFPIVPGKGGLLGSPDRVASLAPPGRDGTAVGPGVWESSGIIDTSAIFGAGTWLYNVQAHSPTVAADKPSQYEDGQILLLRRAHP